MQACPLQMQPWLGSGITDPVREWGIKSTVSKDQKYYSKRSNKTILAIDKTTPI